MIDLPHTPDWQPAGFAGAQDFVRQLAALDLDALQAALRALQLRLGTEDERLGDFERARMLAQEINHRRTGENLRQEVRRLGGDPAFPLS